MIMTGSKKFNLNSSEKKVSLHGNKNYFLKGIIISFIVGYAFFLTSNFTIPYMNSNYYSEMYSVQTIGNKNFELMSWEYSPVKRLMEVIVKIEDYSYKEEQLKIEVKDRLEGKIPSKIIVQNRDLIVVQIEDIPKKFTDISLQISVVSGNNENGVKFYTNATRVKRVDDIQVHKTYEYYIKTLDIQISEYETDIKNNQNSVAALKHDISRANDLISDLSANQTYKTESEKNEVENQINNIKTEINSMENQIVDIEANIKERELQIDNIKAQITAIQEANQ